MKPDLPPEVLALVHGPVNTIAHVEMLLALRTSETEARSAARVAEAAHVSSVTGARQMLRELEAAGLVAERGADEWIFAPRGEPLRRGVDLLAAMYNEKPVTLVRALYERPVHPLHSFAEAFRLRRKD